ncbi:LexA family protein [Seonamhaeicola marinus]|uniref:Translesion error-prone DNA polymerase V autoproteolytic subunit n=1 Tax=Seonamhaeicola marinus TaxID=1912246 RepID=A0A5D0HRQ9_9FLAO|nr:translesion error-prone DNA polymerase V autoproteolytic subunit [Seonamhaeicola marinus]TYA73935.1 translesion error-prone DNA polymerase V autoproteolytic subunit [Seonamhaeicola marinus]
MILPATKKLTFYKPEEVNDSLGALFFDTGISAGFPSPTEDFSEQQRLSLDDELVKNKDTTFFARVSGQSMIGAGLDDNDLLVIDRSLEPENNKIAVCFLDGEFTVKRLRVDKDEVWLKPENPDYPIIKVTAENHFVIWGIVTNVIKKI